MSQRKRKRKGLPQPRRIVSDDNEDRGETIIPVDRWDQIDGELDAGDFGDDLPGGAELIEPAKPDDLRQDRDGVVDQDLPRYAKCTRCLGQGFVPSARHCGAGKPCPTCLGAGRLEVDYTDDQDDDERGIPATPPAGKTRDADTLESKTGNDAAGMMDFDNYLPKESPPEIDNGSRTMPEGCPLPPPRIVRPEPPAKKEPPEPPRSFAIDWDKMPGKLPPRVVREQKEQAKRDQAKARRSRKRSDDDTPPWEQ